jgi:hypothetical protein
MTTMNMMFEGRRALRRRGRVLPDHRLDTRLEDHPRDLGRALRDRRTVGVRASAYVGIIGITRGITELMLAFKLRGLRRGRA